MRKKAEIIFSVLDKEEISNEIIKGFIDESLVSENIRKRIKHLKSEYNNQVYSLILYYLTYIKFPPQLAEHIWKEIVSHLFRLTKLLKRDVGIEIAMLDYFFNIKRQYIYDPLVIDKRIFENIRKRILVDELTGLYNYRYYKMRIKEEVAKSKRKKESFSLVIFDIDDFKIYNDCYGHLEGDKVLKAIAETFKDNLRTSDVVIRYGGEEFVVILPETIKKDALFVAEKLRKEVEGLKFKKKVTVSGGVATFYNDTFKDEVELFKIADGALYRAKYEGKNRICSYPRDRRMYKRIPITESMNVKIKVVSPTDLTQIEKKVKDISRGGICLFIEGDTQDIVKGSYIEGEIFKEKAIITKFTGQIMWKNKIDEDLYELGIKFVKVSNYQISKEEL